MSNSEPKFDLMPRPEARPLDWCQLNSYQQTALKRLRQLLEASADALKCRKANEGKTSERERSGELALDDDRQNRIFFLSGERGSGKTTTGLAVSKLLGDAHAGCAGESAGTSSSTRTPCGKCWDERAEWRKLSDRILVLPSLDLNLAKHSPSLLAAVLERIAWVLEAQDAVSERRSPGLLERSSEVRDAWLKFERLRQSGVQAWHGNLPQRAARIDPATYASEVASIERARLQFESQLNETLEKLAQQGVWRGGEKIKNPLLLLPIDDFYLYPALSMDLLRLLRVLSGPRLFVLVTGDYDVLEELAYQSMLGELMGMATPEALQGLTLQRDYLTGLARQLASSDLRKLIPPAQRFRLEILSNKAALDFKPPGQQSDLSELLKEIQLPNVEFEGTKNEPKKTRDLYHFLTFGEDEPRGEAYAYTGRAILDLPPRLLVDLGTSLALILSEKWQEEENGGKSPGEGSVHRLVKFLVEEFARVLSEQSSMGREEQLKYEGLLHVGQDVDRMSLETRQLEVSYQIRLGWVLKHTEANGNLVPRANALLVVIHDLLALTDGGEGLDGGSLVEKMNDRIPCVLKNNTKILTDQFEGICGSDLRALLEESDKKSFRSLDQKLWGSDKKEALKKALTKVTECLEVLGKSQETSRARD